MSLSRKHYTAVADVFAPRLVNAPTGTDWDFGYTCAAKAIANDLADIFAADNPAFDRARFLAACGVTP